VSVELPIIRKAITIPAETKSCHRYVTCS